MVQISSLLEVLYGVQHNGVEALVVDLKEIDRLNQQLEADSSTCFRPESPEYNLLACAPEKLQLAAAILSDPEVREDVNFWLENLPNYRKQGFQLLPAEGSLGNTGNIIDAVRMALELKIDAERRCEKWGFRKAQPVSWIKKVSAKRVG